MATFTYFRHTEETSLKPKEIYGEEETAVEKSEEETTGRNPTEGFSEANISEVEVTEEKKSTTLTNLVEGELEAG